MSEKLFPHGFWGKYFLGGFSLACLIGFIAGWLAFYFFTLQSSYLLFPLFLWMATTSISQMILAWRTLHGDKEKKFSNQYVGFLAGMLMTLLSGGILALISL